MLPPLKKGLPNLEYMAQILINRAKDDPNLMIVTSDSRGSGRVTGFSEQFPQQLIEVGIAEQNSVGISAGLASCGKKVFTISPGSFLSARSFEQVKNDVAYSNNPVALLGISSGVSYGGLGATHHSIHDIAALMAVPNLDLCIPADNFETETVLDSYLQYPRPMYIRFGKKTMPLFYSSANEVTFGKAGILHQGSDILIIACGEALQPAYEGAAALEAEGISAGLISLHSLRPFDKTTILDMAASSKAVITLEEHSIYGGLGSIVASLLMERRLFRPIKILAFPNEDLVTGSQTDLFDHYGISASGITAAAAELLR